MSGISKICIGTMNKANTHNPRPINGSPRGMNLLKKIALDANKNGRINTASIFGYHIQAIPPLNKALKILPQCETISLLIFISSNISGPNALRVIAANAGPRKANATDLDMMLAVNKCIELIEYRLQRKN